MSTEEKRRLVGDELVWRGAREDIGDIRNWLARTFYPDPNQNFSRNRILQLLDDVLKWWPRIEPKEDDDAGV